MLNFAMLGGRFKILGSIFSFTESYLNSHACLFDSGVLPVGFEVVGEWLGVSRELGENLGLVAMSHFEYDERLSVIWV